MGGLSKIPHWIWYVAGAGAAIMIIILVALRGKAAAVPATGTTTLVPSGTATGSNTAADSSNAISALEAAMQQQNAAYEGILQTLTNTGAGATGGAGSSNTGANAAVGGIRFGNYGNETAHPYYDASGQQVGTLPFGTQIDVTGGDVQKALQGLNASDPATVPVYPFLGPGGGTDFIRTIDLGTFTG